MRALRGNSRTNRRGRIFDDLESRGRTLIVVALTVNMLFGMLILASESIEPAYATFPGANGSIAFHSDRDGNWEIYVMKRDGSAQARRTNNVAYDGGAVWSPDGGRIAFFSERDGNPEIYVMNADGSAQTNLSNNPAQEFAPAWSPDGSKIAFMSNRDGRFQIYVMNADGSAQTNLSNNAFEDTDPAWSPDGSLILFDTTRDGNSEIYYMKPDGAAQTRLTNNPAIDLSPKWSPDGSWVVFDSDRDGNWEVYVMRPDGSAQTDLSKNPAEDRGANYSPDGSVIVFGSNRDGNREIYFMNPDGSAQTRVTNNASDDVAPDWQRVPAPPGGGAPVAVTGAAMDVTATSAILHGTVNPNGLATEWSFWNPSGTVLYCGSEVPLPADSLTYDVQCKDTALTPGQHYDYRLTAKNNAGDSSGNIFGFDTPAGGPTPTSLAITFDPATVDISTTPPGAPVIRVTITPTLQDRVIRLYYSRESPYNPQTLIASGPTGATGQFVVTSWTPPETGTYYFHAFFDGDTSYGFSKAGSNPMYLTAVPEFPSWITPIVLVLTLTSLMMTLRKHNSMLRKH